MIRFSVHTFLLTFWYLNSSKLQTPNFSIANMCRKRRVRLLSTPDAGQGWVKLALLTKNATKSLLKSMDKVKSTTCLSDISAFNIQQYTPTETFPHSDTRNRTKCRKPNGMSLNTLMLHCFAPFRTGGGNAADVMMMVTEKS